MNRTMHKTSKLAAILGALLLCGFLATAQAGIPGMEPSRYTSGDLNRPEFDITARCDFISSPDGNSILIWGYAPGAPADEGRAQYPGPTLIVDEGNVVTINLYNQITDETGALIGENVSMMFPGQSEGTITGAAWVGSPGLLAREALPGDQVRYRFTASQPGTYMYHSGTDPALQFEMGLFGALIVRPALGAGYAYNSEDTRFDHETMFLMSEMDPRVHDLIEWGLKDQVDFSQYLPVYWFLNGRNAPDTLLEPNVPWLPTQPYNCLPIMDPGQKMLMRFIGADRDMHPFHPHGNHTRVVARNGRLLSSDAATAGADLAVKEYTVQVQPGGTIDAIYQWTGEELGWDAYGDPGSVAFAHTCDDAVDNESGAATPDGFDDTTWEYCADHGKPLPVVMPENQDLAFGGFWSGSPFLGGAMGLPPGEGGLNPWNGFTLIWHSHREKELVNFDIFPGGSITFLIITPPGTTPPTAGN